MSYDEVTIQECVSRHMELGNSFDAFLREVGKTPTTYGVDTSHKNWKQNLRMFVCNPRANVYDSVLEDLELLEKVRELKLLKKVPGTNKPGVSYRDFIIADYAIDGIEVGFSGERKRAPAKLVRRNRK